MGSLEDLRVKVIRRNEDGNWDDERAGHLTDDYWQGTLLVTGEEHNEQLFWHHISSDNIYRNPDDKIIIISWTDSENLNELGLSFQDTAECSDTWDQILCHLPYDHEAHISTFLQAFPTPLHYSKPESLENPWVFWSQHEPSQIDPDCLVHQKIRSAFSKLRTSLYTIGFVQFWAPVKTRGKQLLTTSNQPFAVGDPSNKDMARYRLRSMKYQYNIDVNNVQEDPTIIHGSPAATAFQNQMPDLIPDLKVCETTPLVSSALECGLTGSFLLPVFYPSQSCCVGIVECVAYSIEVLAKVVKKFNKALEEVGFKTFEHLKNKTIDTLKHTKDEIDEALKTICETHRLDFAQVWIAYDYESFVTSSSSLEDIQTTRVAGLLTLSNYVVETFDEHLDRFYEDYKAICDVCPLKMGEGPAGYTLQTCKPYFIKSVSELSNNKLMGLTCDADIECSCFVLSLRSTETSDLEYTFEFLIHKIRDRVILLETLMLTLKWCLPSFKYAYGGELGAELSIVDVEDAIGSETEFKIFQECKLLHVPKAPEKGKRPMVEQCLAHNKSNWKTAPILLLREDIEPQFGKTMKEAAENLKVSLSTLKRKCKEFGILEWPGKGHDLKRKINESYNYQSNANKDRRIQYLQTSNDGEMNLGETLTFKAEFVDDIIRFDIPMSSATLAAIQKEIEEGFKLNHDDYKLKYLDEDGDWILITSEKSMDGCIKSQKSLASTTIRLCLFSSQI